jgi:hypothetical protein
MMRHRPALLCLLALLVLPAARLHAATYCVDTAQEFQQALTAAAASNVDDEIRLKPGVYSFFQPFLYQTTTPHWVFISGGWSEFNSIECGRQTFEATATVLDGENQRQILLMTFNPPEATTQLMRHGVNNLTFRNGKASEFGRGGGLYMFSFNRVITEYWIDNVIFHNNSGYFAGGAEFYLPRGLLRVVNSLFYDNAAPTSAFAHFNVTMPEGDAPTDVLVANSTFVDGACPGSGGRGCGIGAGLGATVHMEIINSLFWGNGISDVNIEGLTVAGFGSGTAAYRYSRVPITGGNIVPTQSDGSLLDPRFVEPATNDWRLADDSPYIDRGLAPLPVYGQFFADIANRPRIRFAAQDAGAHENQTRIRVFGNGFEPGLD